MIQAMGRYTLANALDALGLPLLGRFKKPDEIVSCNSPKRE